MIKKPDWLAVLLIVSATLIFGVVLWQLFHVPEPEPIVIPGHVEDLVISTPTSGPTEPPVEFLDPVEESTFNPKIPLPEDLQIVLYEVCEESGVSVSLALGLIEVECCFDLDADNGMCYGPCQLNRNYFPDNLSYADNIREGIWHLGGLLEQYKSTAAALTVYNAGHDTGNRGYANAVLEVAEWWENELKEVE